MGDHVSVEICGDGAGGSTVICHGSLSESGRAGIVVYGDPAAPGGTINQGNVYGPPMVEMGQLSDGSYGLAAVNPAGQLVKLSVLAFGLVAAADPVRGTRTGTVVNDYVWGDLDGAGVAVGPSVTVEIGDTGRALVLFGCEPDYGAPVADGIGCWASVEVSGATSISADKTWAAGANANPVEESRRFAAMKFHLFTGLTPGLHTFTMKYAVFGVVGGTPSVGFQDREIAVLPF